MKKTLVSSDVNLIRQVTSDLSGNHFQYSKSYFLTDLSQKGFKVLPLIGLHNAVSFLPGQVLVVWKGSQTHVGCQ